MCRSGIGQRYGRRTGERGFALLSAMVFLVVVLALGGSIVAQAMQEVDTAGRAKKETRAFNLAEAGIDYAAWQLYNHPTTSLPATWSRSDLDGGSFAVVAQTYPGCSNAVVLTSTGTSQARTAEVKVVGQFLPTQATGQNAVFDHALFSNVDLTLKGNFNVTGNAHSNGNMTLQGNPSVDGNVAAGGWIHTQGNPNITGTTTASVPRVAMPAIDLQHYQDIATVVYSSGHTFSGNTNLSGVVYVNGNASFNGNFSGQGTIVVSGKATVNGNARIVQAGDEFAIIAGGGVKINGNCTIDGWIYTHNMDVPGQFQGNGNAAITGGVAADLISVNGNMTIHYKEPTVELPGASSAPAQFYAVSWRRLR